MEIDSRDSLRPPLPKEIISRISHFISLSAKPVKILKFLALFRDWRDAAQSCIFKTVRVKGWKQMKRFSRSIGISFNGRTLEITDSHKRFRALVEHLDYAEEAEATELNHTIDFKNILKACKNLREVMFYSMMPYGTALDFDIFNGLDKLETLSLKRCRIKTCYGSLSLPNLTTLSLDDFCEVTPNGFVSFPKNSMPKLETLNLSAGVADWEEEEDEEWKVEDSSVAEWASNVSVLIVWPGTDSSFTLSIIRASARLDLLALSYPYELLHKGSPVYTKSLIRLILLPEKLVRERNEDFLENMKQVCDGINSGSRGCMMSKSLRMITRPTIHYQVPGNYPDILAFSSFKKLKINSSGTINVSGRECYGGYSGYGSVQNCNEDGDPLEDYDGW